MDNTDPTSVIKLIKDLKSSSEGHSCNSGVSLRLSGTGIPMTLIGDSHKCESPPKRKRYNDSTDSSFNNSSAELCSVTPWEWRRLKGEVVSLRTRLSHQEAHAQQLHKLRRQMEEVFEKEKSILESQAERDKQTIKQLEARIEIVRKNAQEAKDAEITAIKELSLTRSKLEQKIASLMNENAELLESRQDRNAVENISLGSRDAEPDESNALQAKLKSAEARIADLEEELRGTRSAQQEMELTCVQLQTAKINIERLESERLAWEEAKSLSARASRVSDLERELNTARETIASMRELVKGKLLLEEEMCNTRHRIEHTEKLEEQVASLQSEKSEILRKLEKFESIGFGGDPAMLRRELSRLQQAEAVLTAEGGQLRSKDDSLQREIASVKQKYEEAKKIATEMTTSTERLNKLIARLQKKMILVTRERDSYRHQLDLYEKETTTAENQTLITDRIPALERALESYRDLVSKLEADLGVTETSAARDENQKLRAEIEQLKGELEHRALKGDFNCNARILHFSANPASIAGQLAEEKQKALIKEVEELRARVQVGNNTSAVGFSSLQAQEIAELKKTHEIKIDRLKDAFKISSQQYRQACYQLFGWRVDRTKEGEYKLFSQYAESPDDFLFFHVGEEGVDLLETSFSSTLGHLIERHLQMQHSVPMFINAVQCELFAQQTVTNIV